MDQEIAFEKKFKNKKLYWSKNRRKIISSRIVKRMFLPKFSWKRGLKSKVIGKYKQRLRYTPERGCFLEFDGC